MAIFSHMIPAKHRNDGKKGTTNRTSNDSTGRRPHRRHRRTGHHKNH